MPGCHTDFGFSGPCGRRQPCQSADEREAIAGSRIPDGRFAKQELLVVLGAGLLR